MIAHAQKRMSWKRRKKSENTHKHICIHEEETIINSTTSYKLEECKITHGKKKKKKWVGHKLLKLENVRHRSRLTGFSWWKVIWSIMLSMISILAVMIILRRRLFYFAPGVNLNILAKTDIPDLMRVNHGVWILFQNKLLINKPFSNLLIFTYSHTQFSLRLNLSK